MEKDTYAKTSQKIGKSLPGTKETEFSAHICSNGSLTVPKEVRDALSLEEGSLLRCEISKMAGRASEKEATK